MAEPSQRLVFTVIPDGIDGDRARLNLHIAPRLDVPAGTDPADLTLFKAWQDWPAVINAARLQLLVNGQATAVRRRRDAVSATWTALFPVTTPVRTHAFEDLRGTEVLAYPLAELARAIENDYVAMAGNPADELPRTRDLEKLMGYRVPREADRKTVIGWLAGPGDKPISDRSKATALLAEYHRPLGVEKTVVTAPASGDPHEAAAYRTQDRVKLPDEAELAAKFDFHRLVSALGQHPVLMSECGLVVPLEMRLGDLPAGDFDLQIEIDWDHRGTATDADVRTLTHARRAGGDFRARPKSAVAIDGGWLRLNPARFQLVAMDVDGAGLSLKNFTINLPGMNEERFDDEDFGADRVARVGTPRLRTAGLQLAHSRRDMAIKGLFDGSGGLNDAMVATGKVEVFAEDIVRGWRADMWDDRSGQWQSLLRFDGKYDFTVTGGGITSADEEATLRLGATKAADGSAPKLLKASEAMFAWSGWSLAAPQPGLAIMPDDVTHAEAPNTVPDGLPLKVSPRATRGSLPLLRFGRTYRVRMRYTDIAGGGIGWHPDDVPGAQIASRPVFFGRYEPVEAPALTLIKGGPLPKDGESMARAALRSLDIAADNDVLVRRNIVPPRIGVHFAERHGVLDAGGRPDPGLYDTLVHRDADYDHVETDTPAFAPGGGTPDRVKTRFAVGPEAELTPYLYDPLAFGAALRIGGVPGINPDKIWRVPFVGDVFDPAAAPKWPSARGFSIVASETGVTGWDAGTRTFRVVLAPAERARIRVSALVPKNGLRLFKLLDELRLRAEADPGGEAPTRYEAAVQAVRAGQHWMFTPWRVVELVHAVQRPIVTPAFLMLSASRAAGDATAHIHWGTPIHCKSTARIDVGAGWLEIDDHGADGPQVTTFETQAFRRPFARLDFPAEGAAKRLEDNHVFADTRARHVEYGMTATTRFREFMAPKLREDAALLVRDSACRAIWVPASSAPPAPVISYVVPTFGWSTSGTGDKRTSWRSGGGIRVYLDRPWYGSGSNEMLAVLLPMVASFADDNGPQKDFITQWGADPIWAGPRVKTIAPARTAFPRRIDKGPVPYDFGDGAVPNPAAPDGAAAGDNWPLTNLRPPGAPDGISVEAVPHAVGYDRARKLWYCDIVVRPGDAYFPFIRLALARYQPHSRSGMELSSVAMAAFQQLAPDRVATLSTVTGFGGRRRRIAVHGKLPGAGTPRPAAGAISVQLQRLVPGGDPDLDWRDTPQGPAPAAGPNAGPLGRRIGSMGSAFHIARNALTVEQRSLVRLGEQLLGAGDFTAVLARPDLVELLLPPLIYEETFQLPLPSGDRLRLLVTERETYSIDAENGGRSLGTRERIVYAAAIEL